MVLCINKIRSYSKYIFVASWLIITGLFEMPAIDAQTVTLEEIIQYAQENSPEAMRINTSKENKYWLWKTYKAEYKPQLVLEATLPAYENENKPVIQDDGSVVYRNINQSQAYTGLSLEQNIGLTGGKLFVSSDLSRLDDFSNDSLSYSGSPFYIGLEQPLFGFNKYKWMNHIEPLKYDESLKEYIEGNEKIAYYTTLLYFNLLVSQISYQIATTDKAHADTIYKIGKEKYTLGKISKNELLQLKFGVITAEKAMATASLSTKTSKLKLFSYTGIQEEENVMLALPVNIHKLLINEALALEKALENSRRSVEFKREILEAQRDAEKARRESLLNANLTISYGQTNVAGNIGCIYENPQTLQTLNVGFTVPILDWGRAKATRKTAEANLQLVQYTVEQNEINFRQEVITQIENYNMLMDFIEFTHEADNTAAERYEIARLRYMAGDISLTEYNIALAEKDQAKQDYILALRDYWLSYYSIRILTLYDFEMNQQLVINKTITHEDYY
jgi:uncharacterized membrane protein